MGLIDKPFNFFIIFHIHWERIPHIIWSFFHSSKLVFLLQHAFVFFIVPRTETYYVAFCRLSTNLFQFSHFSFLFFSSNFQYSLDAATCSEAPVCIEVNIHIKIKRLTCFGLSVLETNIKTNKQQGHNLR